ncbi:unnamed protein product [Rhizophagus irregularis]|nr:unnamed protein product [Rhizophagus irregularis]
MVDQGYDSDLMDESGSIDQGYDSDPMEEASNIEFAEDNYESVLSNLASLITYIDQESIHEIKDKEKEIYVNQENESNKENLSNISNPYNTRTKGAPKKKRIKSTLENKHYHNENMHTTM